MDHIFNSAHHQLQGVPDFLLIVLFCFGIFFFCVYLWWFVVSRRGTNPESQNLITGEIFYINWFDIIDDNLLLHCFLFSCSTACTLSPHNSHFWGQVSVIARGAFTMHHMRRFLFGSTLRWKRCHPSDKDDRGCRVDAVFLSSRVWMTSLRWRFRPGVTTSHYQVEFEQIVMRKMKKESSVSRRRFFLQGSPVVRLISKVPHCSLWAL